MTELDNALKNLNSLKISESLTKELKTFCNEALVVFENKIESINIVGSAATIDYISGASDINALVVFSELEISDLGKIAPKIEKIWKRAKISPRFISKRNLLSSTKYLPIDFWTMQKYHTVIYGIDILNDITINNENLLWQLRHEIKGLRMRLKQQYWRSENNPIITRKNIVTDFNTVMYLSKALLYLKNNIIPAGNEETAVLIKNKFGIDASFIDEAVKIKSGIRKIEKKDIPRLFSGLLNYIRSMDDISEKI